MPELKHTTGLKVVTETVYYVYYADLERFIGEIYGREFSMPADLECPNDSIHEYYLRYEQIYSIVDPYDQDKLKRWLGGSHVSYMTRIILQDLLNQGLLEPGHYIINVSW